MPYPTKPKGGWQRPRQVVVTKSTAQLRETKAARKFLNKYQQIFRPNMAQSSNNPGPFPLPRGRENICVNPRRNDEEHSIQPLIRTDAKRLQSRGSTNTRDNNGQRSSGPYDDAAGVFDESGRWSDAENDQSRRYGRTGSQERSNATTNDGISGRRDPEKQVSDAALQTDTCDTLYVTKNTLTAYTIAIIQNSQVSQYDQMHAAITIST